MGTMPKEAPVTVVSLRVLNIILSSAILTERHDVLHAHNEHKSRARIAGVCLRSEVSSRDEADNETELLQRPSFGSSQ